MIKACSKCGIEKELEYFLVYLKDKIDYDEVILNDLKKFQLFCYKKWQISIGDI